MDNIYRRMTRLISVLLCMVLFFSGFVFASQEVLLNTDAKEYSKGQIINMTMKNNLSEGIYSASAGVTPGMAIDKIELKQKDGSWKAYEVRCSWPECDIDFDGPVEIRPGDSVSFSWLPVIYIKGQGIDGNAPGPGVYRLVSGYQLRKGQDSKKWQWAEVRSNEFQIK